MRRHDGMVRFPCPNPHCGTTLKVDPAMCDHRMHCPQCHSPVALPGWSTQDMPMVPPRRTGSFASRARVLVLLGIVSSLFLLVSGSVVWLVLSGETPSRTPIGGTTEEIPTSANSPETAAGKETASPVDEATRYRRLAAAIFTDPEVGVRKPEEAVNLMALMRGPMLGDLAIMLNKEACRPHRATRLRQRFGPPQTIKEDMTVTYTEPLAGGRPLPRSASFRGLVYGPLTALEEPGTGLVVLMQVNGPFEAFLTEVNRRLEARPLTAPPAKPQAPPPPAPKAKPPAPREKVTTADCDAFLEKILGKATIKDLSVSHDVFAAADQATKVGRALDGHFDVKEMRFRSTSKQPLARIDPLVRALGNTGLDVDLTVEIDLPTLKRPQVDEALGDPQTTLPGTLLTRARRGDEPSLTVTYDPARDRTVAWLGSSNQPADVKPLPVRWLRYRYLDVAVEAPWEMGAVRGVRIDVKAFLRDHPAAVRPEPPPAKVLDEKALTDFLATLGSMSSLTVFLKQVNEADDKAIVAAFGRAKKLAAGRPLPVGFAAAANELAPTHNGRLLVCLVDKPQWATLLTDRLGREERVEKTQPGITLSLVDAAPNGRGAGGGTMLSVSKIPPHNITEWRHYGWLAFGIKDREVIAIKAECGRAAERLGAFLKADEKDDAPPKVKDAKPPLDNGEALADRRLKFAKSLLADKVRDKARDRLEEIVRTYPKTKAANEARAILEEMEK